MAAGPRVLMITSRWNAISDDDSLIIAALEHRGARVTEVSLEQLSVRVVGGQLTIEVDGRPSKKPDAVLSRVSEQFWGDLEPVLAAILQLGLWVVNGPGLWTAASKWSTALALHRSGLAQVPTRYVPGRGRITKWPQTRAGRVAGVDVSVAKPPFGAGGDQIEWIDSERTANAGRLVEPYACHPDQVKRVFVAGSQSRVALRRPTGDPLTPSSLKLGATPVRTELTPELAGLAELATRSVGLTAFSGIDVVEWREDQLLDFAPVDILLGDVNGSPGLSSVQSVAPELDVFGIYADAVIADIATHA
jgi:glutathione synthase/RimK-type ligase-like ATP-grasp enzyme